MPQMPSPPIGEYQQTTSLADPFRRITPHEDMGIAGATGAALTSVGEAGLVAQHAQGAMYAQETLGHMQGTWTQKMSTAQQNAPAGAPNFTSGVMTDFDKDAADAVANAPNQVSRNFVNESMLRLRNEIQARAISFETVARTQHDNFTNQQSNNAAANELIQHPEVFDQRLAERNTLFDQMPMSGNAREEWKSKTREQLATAAAQGLIRQNPQAAMSDLQSDNPQSLAIAALDPQVRKALLTQAKGQFVDQKAASIVDTFRTSGPQIGTKALSGIDNDSSIPADMKDDVRKGVNQGVNQLREEAQQQNVQTIAALHERIAKGEATDKDRGTVWRLYHSNAFSPMEVASALGDIDRVQMKSVETGVTQAAIADAFTNRTPLDPTDKDVKTGVVPAVSEFFMNRVKGVDPTSQQWSNTAADIAERTGVVPEPAVNWARAYLTSGDPAKAAAAANLVAKLEERAPRAVGFAVDEKTKAMADSVNIAVRSGTDPQVAVEQARQNATLSKGDDKVLDKLWQQSNADKSQKGSLVDRVKGDFAPGWFSKVPDVPVAMQSDYDQATKRYYDLTGGNLAQARDLAARDVKRVWGVSQVNGQREIMPYAPESMFPGLTADVVRNDLAAHLKDVGMPQGTKISDVRLVPTDHTARTAGLEGWSVQTKDELGAFDTVRNSRGDPVNYRLPVNALDYATVQDRVRQAQIAETKRVQAQRQQEAGWQEQADSDQESMAPEYWRIH